MPHRPQPTVAKINPRCVRKGVAFLQFIISEEDKQTLADWIAEDPLEWWAKPRPYSGGMQMRNALHDAFHFRGGMQMRNALRDAGMGEEFFGVDNLDDLYVVLLELAIANWLHGRSPCPNASAESVHQHHKARIAALDPAKVQAAVAYLRKMWSEGAKAHLREWIANCEEKKMTLQDAIGYAEMLGTTAECHASIASFHFIGGMRVRNALRQADMGEEFFGVDNLDDIYVPLIEIAVERP